MKDTITDSTASDKSDMNKIFVNLPGLYLILSPELIIVNASNSYLKATFTEREKIVGKHLFEIFPDNPEVPEAKGVENLTSSLKTVLRTRLPHEMNFQRYDVRNPNRSEEFTSKYWKPLNIPVLNENGEVEYIIHNVVDVTSNMITNAELKKTQEREKTALLEVEYQKTELSRIFEQAPVAITILTGPQYVIQLANPPVCELWGREKEDVLGKPLFEAMPELTGQGVEQLLESVFTTGMPYIGRELPFTLNRAKGPEEVYFNFVYKPLIDNHLITGIIVVATEVTDEVLSRKYVEEKEKDLLHLNKELLAANEEIQAANEEIQASNEEIKATIEELLRTQDALKNNNDNLEEVVEKRTAELRIRERKLDELTKELTSANEEITASMEELSYSNQRLTTVNLDMDNFIYTASHDLKAPIANIEGLMDVLIKNLSSESKANAEKIIQLIRVSIARFKRTISDLTEVVKIQKEEIFEESINIMEMIEDVKMDLLVMIEESKTEIIYDGCDALKIKFSPKNLKSIIYNLLSNAIKYKSPDRFPLIKISCYKENGYRVLSFQDNGLGMNLTSETKIFSMFKRLHNHVEGSGIGLYIVKKIIENAGGRIEVSSKVGEGSNFKVYVKEH